MDHFKERILRSQAHQTYRLWSHQFCQNSPRFAGVISANSWVGATTMKQTTVRPARKEVENSHPFENGK